RRLAEGEPFARADAEIKRLGMPRERSFQERIAEAEGSAVKWPTRRIDAGVQVHNWPGPVDADISAKEFLVCDPHQSRHLRIDERIQIGAVNFVAGGIIQLAGCISYVVVAEVESGRGKGCALDPFNARRVMRGGLRENRGRQRCN